MRILAQDARAGEMRLRPETVDDLWHLSHVVVPGDVVVALTWRTPEEAATDKVRTGKVEKRAMTLGVRVEQVELHASSDRLRLLGVIVEGPQEHGAHHTLNVEPRTEVTVRKERWTAEEQRRVAEAVEASRRPVATFVAVEDDEAVIAVLRQMGVVKAAEIAGHVSGKRYEARVKEARESFFAETLEAVRNHRSEGPLVVLGPGFWKEQFLAFAKEKDAEAVRGAVVEHTGHGGMAGVTEAIRRGVVDRVSAESRAAVEMIAVEAFLEALAKNEPVTYGEDHCARALDAGAVARLLVADDRVRTGGARLLDRARATGAETVVVSAQSEPGRKLVGLGGYAATLRYALPDV